MNRYQIRVPEDFAVEDVIEEMAGKGWDAIAQYLDHATVHVPLKNYRRFQNAMYRVATPHLRKFPLCGYPDFCTDSVTAAPLQELPLGLDKAGPAQIYHIFLNCNLQEFLEEITLRAFEAIENIVKPERTETVLSRLREIFATVLADYLYYNPVCGKTEFCTEAEKPLEVFQ